MFDAAVDFGTQALDLSSQHLANDPDYRRQHSKVLHNLSFHLNASKDHLRALGYAQETVQFTRALLVDGKADAYPSNVALLITSLVLLRDTFIDLNDTDSRLSISKELFTLLKQCHVTDFSQIDDVIPQWVEYFKGGLVFDLGRDLWMTENMDEASQATAVDALRFCSEYLPTVAGQEVASLMVLNDLGTVLRRRGEAGDWIIPTMATHARKWFESGAISVPHFAQTLITLAADQYQRSSFGEALDTLEGALRLLAGYVDPVLGARRAGTNAETNESTPVEHGIAFYLYALEMKQALLVLNAKDQAVSPQGALEAALEILTTIESTLALFPAPKFYRARLWSGFYWRPKVLVELGDHDGALKYFRRSSADNFGVQSAGPFDVYGVIALIRGLRLGVLLGLQHLRGQMDDGEIQDGIEALKDISSQEDVANTEYLGTLLRGDHDFWPHDRSMLS
jgi:tetratricopeptide (TPR) repeat protein